MTFLLPALLACAVGPSGPPPVVLVSLDTLRADRLGAFGSAAGLSPNLDRFAREAVVFERTYSQSGETLFSHASLFTSRYPSELGPVDYTFSPPGDVPGLAEVLELYGYESAAFVAGGHMDPVFGLDTGWGHWESVQDWGALAHTVPPALDWLDARETEAPFLLLVHGYDTHDRYLKPSPWGHLVADPTYRGAGSKAAARVSGAIQAVDGLLWQGWRFDEIHDLQSLRVRAPENRAARAAQARAEGARPFTDEDMAHLAATYDGSVAWADAWFGVLMAGLEAQGVLDEAVIVVFSDHGEELGEDGVFSHRLSLSEAVLRVPLMIRLPGGAEGGRRVSDLTALLDVAPTVLDLAGARAPGVVRGRSLVPATRGDPQPVRRAIHAEGVFRMVAAVGQEGGLVFSGLSAHEPRLAGAIAAAAPEGPSWEPWPETPEESLPELRSLLETWKREVSPRTDGRALDPEKARILQERGYWGP